MKVKILNLIEELRDVGKEKFPYSNKRQYDPESQINVWYVISKIDDVLLSDTKQTDMRKALQKTVVSLKNSPSCVLSPIRTDTKVNVWYVIAQLYDVIL